MTNVQMKMEALVKSIDSVNAEYILTDNRYIDKLETAQRFEEKNREEMVKYLIEEMTKYVTEFNDKNLTPANVKVGDGVTVHLYSDSHACTVTKVTKSSVTVQQDTATLDPNWKPEFVVGGFAGHCTNQNDQTYTYERNENGQEYTFRWSKKYNQYRQSKSGLKLFKGRREFYDYNF
jgi:hypothetical protein